MNLRQQGMLNIPRRVIPETLSPLSHPHHLYMVKLILKPKTRYFFLILLSQDVSHSLCQGRAQPTTYTQLSLKNMKLLQIFNGYFASTKT